MRRKIGEALETDAVSVTDVHGDGRHVSIDVVAAAFEGKSAVARQRLVYKVRALRVRACVCVAHAASAGRGRLCRGRRLLGGVCRPLRPPSADAYRSLTPSCPHVASSSPSARRPSGRSWRRRCTRDDQDAGGGGPVRGGARSRARSSRRAAQRANIERERSVECV